MTPQEYDQQIERDMSVANLLDLVEDLQLCSQRQARRIMLRYWPTSALLEESNKHLMETLQQLKDTVQTIGHILKEKQ